MFDMTIRDAITYIVAINYSTEALIFFLLNSSARTHSHIDITLYAYIIMFMFVSLLLYK